MLHISKRWIQSAQETKFVSSGHLLQRVIYKPEILSFCEYNYKWGIFFKSYI